MPELAHRPAPRNHPLRPVLDQTTWAEQEITGLRHRHPGQADLRRSSASGAGTSRRPASHAKAMDAFAAAALGESRRANTDGHEGIRAACQTTTETAG
jgi:hypothetical protein